MKNRGYWLLGAILLLITPVLRAQSRHALEGKASFYSDRFHGRRTSNGERYHKNKFTAAHRTLPFNTLVKVVNTFNGKECQVRINDRGPYSHKRVLDVSKAAAKALGLTHKGVGSVKLIVLSDTTPHFDHKNRLENSGDSLQEVKQEQWLTSARLRNKVYYSLDGQEIELDGYASQINTFRVLENAKNEWIRLKKAGFDQIYLQRSRSRKGDYLYKLVTGVARQKKEALLAYHKLKEQGFSPMLVKV